MLLRLLMVVAAAPAFVVVPMSSPATARACAQPPPPAVAAPLEQAAPSVPLVTTATSIRWTRVSKRVTYGDTALLEGQVVTGDGAITEADVDLFARAAGRQDWARVASTTSDAETGVFTFDCLLPERTTSYRVSYAGTLMYAASDDTRRVDVARRMPDVMRQVSRSRFVFNGSVSPRYDGGVDLQRRSCRSCAWRNVAVGATDDRSRWRFTVDVSRLAGKLSYRAVIPADGRFGRSFSERVWRITVR